MRSSAAILVALVCATALVPPLHAQSAAEQIAAGDRDHAALNIRGALEHYRAAIAVDSTNYDALCKAAMEAVDLGEFAATDALRDTLYRAGEQYARRAVAANPKGADGHFHLARAVGRRALTMGTRDQIKYGGTEVHNEALAALAINPKHAGALHVMGVWNQKIMELNWASRLIAKTILGGGVMGEASWDNAQKYLEQAVALEPNRIIHHLDLGRIYADRDDKAKAREQFEWIERAPALEYNDNDYKHLAAQALKALGTADPVQAQAELAVSASFRRAPIVMVRYLRTIGSDPS